MKITMYELLGLVKDGKAPKKISYNDIELEYDKDTKDYYSYYGKYLFEYKFAECVDFLDDEVEIVEEDKKIEKKPVFLSLFNLGLNFSNIFITLFNQFNKLITQIPSRINNIITFISKIKFSISNHFYC